MERLTHERANGIKTGYWSAATKEALVQRPAAYENTGLEPEEICEAIRAAAAASDEHNELVHLRGNMADLAGMAQRAKNSDEETKAMRLDVLMDSCISIGRLMGFLRREE